MLYFPNVSNRFGTDNLRWIDRHIRESASLRIRDFTYEDFKIVVFFDVAMGRCSRSMNASLAIIDVSFIR